MGFSGEKFCIEAPSCSLPTGAWGPPDSASQFLCVPSVVANRVIRLESCGLGGIMMLCFEDFFWELGCGFWGIVTEREFVLCLVKFIRALELLWFLEVVRGLRSCCILLFMVFLLRCVG